LEARLVVWKNSVLEVIQVRKQGAFQFQEQWKNAGIFSDEEIQFCHERLNEIEKEIASKYIQMDEQIEQLVKSHREQAETSLTRSVTKPVEAAQLLPAAPDKKPKKKRATNTSSKEALFN
jgi:hypothetical protein